MDELRIESSCPLCGQPFETSLSSVGEFLQCPACHEQFETPELIRFLQHPHRPPLDHPASGKLTPTSFGGWSAVARFAINDSELIEARIDFDKEPTETEIRNFEVLQQSWLQIWPKIVVSLGLMLPHESIGDWVEWSIGIDFEEGRLMKLSLTHSHN